MRSPRQALPSENMRLRSWEWNKFHFESRKPAGDPAAYDASEYFFKYTINNGPNINGTFGTPLLGWMLLRFDNFIKSSNYLYVVFVR